MTKQLKMPFRNAAGNTVNFMLANPKEGITKAEVLANDGSRHRKEPVHHHRWRPRQRARTVDPDLDTGVLA